MLFFSLQSGTLGEELILGSISMPTADCQYIVRPQEKLPALIYHSTGAWALRHTPLNPALLWQSWRLESSRPARVTHRVKLSQKTGTHMTKHEDRLKREGTAPGAKEAGRQLSQKPTVVKAAPENLVEGLPAFSFESAKENLKGNF